MTDVENTFRAELNRMLAVDATPDWEGVLASAREAGGDARGRRLGIAAAALLAAAAVALVTPLGGAIARGLEDFTTWLTGEPGTPVAEEEQRAFDEENQRTWLGFPEGTQLRRLITRRVDDVTVELLGFRAGTSRLCLRLIVSGTLQKKALECAPLDELRREGGPVRVLITDESVGPGDKVAWYGIHRVTTNQLRITAGVAADGVRAVVLGDSAGRHEAVVAANAFLYVAEQPDVGQFVQEVWARTEAGLVAVPFAPTPTLFGSGPSRQPPPAPPVEREVTGGAIGWIEDRDERGEPLEVLPDDERMGLALHVGQDVEFGRVLTPDPDDPLRIVVTLGVHPRLGSDAVLCTTIVSRARRGGSCKPFPGVFDRGQITYGMAGGGPGAFVMVHGVASDDVARVAALLAGGPYVDVPLSDNVYAVDLPRAGLPARLVAYDSEDRVIAVSDVLPDFDGGTPGPARGKAELIWRVTGPDGSYAELRIGPSNRGGECMYLKDHVDDRHRGFGTSCAGPKWTGPAVRLHAGSAPGRFVQGRVRDDVKTVRLLFADGETAVVVPRRGYVLYATPAEHLTDGHLPVGAVGLNAAGKVVGRVSFPPFPPPPRRDG